MPKRPVIKIKPVFLDYLLEICSALILISTIVVIITRLAFSSALLTHLGMYGSANAFGNKHTLFIPLIVAILIYTGLTIVTRYPHIYNYPVKITEQNVLHVYKMGIRTMRIIKLLTLILLLFLTLKTIFGI